MFNLNVGAQQAAPSTQQGAAGAQQLACFRFTCRDAAQQGEPGKQQSAPCSQQLRAVDEFWAVALPTNTASRVRLKQVANSAKTRLDMEILLKAFFK
ncbi:hypothetical protein SAMN05421753_106240 [Planctomicrobium piriforme]|uniref:Uncharacterized protein n=1 Tax=Planctomicrobium piriforme TaxID=1576369 RepID=A0A1I3G8W1_9PLAN|nr:hypothetical protein SAMN05421753_106240 [Planctomicrobium piriforme]